MSQNDQDLQDLLAWGREHSAGLDAKVEVYQDPTTGFSFRAIEDLQPGVTVSTCSYPISLSYLNSISNTRFQSRSQPFPKDFLHVLGEDDPNVIGFFFLMQQFLLKEKSFWWPYIRLLPQPNKQDSLAIPSLWPEDDCHFLDGTNADPSIKKRKELWISEWQKAISLLQNRFTDWQDYSYDLYKWAATIFGSRSFRASLVVADGILTDGSQAQNHVGRDRFSILLPIIDIGNHNGVNSVDWIPNRDSGLSFTNRTFVPKGDQIFNFYGDKSNSELLVSYGFMLPKSSDDEWNHDSVNLKLKPSPQALQLRRLQTCHKVPSNPDEEFMFRVQKHTDYHNIPEMSHFPHDLIDFILCMVGNQREVQTFLSLRSNWSYCAGKDPNLYTSPLYRGSLQVLQILHHKLKHEILRLQESGARLGPPENSNHILAVEYRDRQLAVLHSAIQPIIVRLNILCSTSSFCNHPNHSVTNQENQRLRIREENETEMLSLECAFDWLRINHYDIYNPIVQMISDDQEEPLPLNWAVLLEDWDRTYWIVWIYVVMMIFSGNNQSYPNRLADTERSVQSWADYSQWAFETHFDDTAISNCIADESEKETIDLMLRGVAKLPEIAAMHLTENSFFGTNTEKLRNFASFLVQEETLISNYIMADGQPLPQRVLCIRKINQYK